MIKPTQKTLPKKLCTNCNQPVKGHRSVGKCCTNSPVPDKVTSFITSQSARPSSQGAADSIKGSQNSDVNAGNTDKSDASVSDLFQVIQTLRCSVASLSEEIQTINSVTLTLLANNAPSSDSFSLQSATALLLVLSWLCNLSHLYSTPYTDKIKI